MKPIKMGAIRIDPIAYGSQGNAILGIRDSGKTYTATWLAEQLFEAGIPFVAFDPIGVWRFLRVPGKGPGYKVVVAGGKDGNLPLTVRGAPEIVRAAMRQGVSLIIDLFDINLSKGDWRKIVTECVKVLLHENSAHGLRHVFIEEAAEFIPQKVLDGVVYAEIEKLARMGGNSRLGYTLINQRSQEVSKAILELCENIFLHRQRGKNALENLDKWLSVAGATQQKEIMKSLPELPQGQCWAWLGGDTPQPPALVKVPQKNSLHPDRRVMRGDETAAQQSAVDVGDFVEKLKSTLVTVEQEAKDNDPRLLRSQLTDLQRQLAAAQQAVGPDPAALKAAEERGFAAGFLQGAASGNRLLADVQRGWDEGMSPAVVSFRNVLDVAIKDSERILKTAPKPLPAAITVRPGPIGRDLAQIQQAVQNHRAALLPAEPSRRAVAPNGDGEKLPKVERLILTALAQYADGRTKKQIAILTGYALGGGGFNNGLGALRAKSFIADRGDETIYITASGLQALGPYEPLPHGAALLEHWMRQLEKAERLTLAAVAAAYPGDLSKEETAEAAGYAPSGGGFNNALGRLRSLELIEGKGRIRASDNLFG
jgi:hypothetical protein